MIRRWVLPHVSSHLPTIAATAALRRQEAAAAALRRQTLNGELTLIHARLSGRPGPPSALTHPAASIHMFTLVWGAARSFATDQRQPNKHTQRRGFAFEEICDLLRSERRRCVIKKKRCGKTGDEYFRIILQPGRITQRYLKTKCVSPLSLNKKHTADKWTPVYSPCMPICPWRCCQYSNQK